MGVVRDVTIDNLTQAVQGISSTGISDSTGQAINNTLSTLGKDTSLQGIISSISGLGQTLGSDKANISGDNIVNPSAFRGNIGLSVSTTTTDANGGTVRRWGNIVSIIFQGTTGTNIGSVPSGYRPQSAAERTIIYVEKYNGSTLTNRYYALLLVESNGNISCSYLSSYGGTSFVSAKNANHKLYGNITYIIANND